VPRSHEHVIAVYQGSFDPVTLGHLDVIRRSSRLFNELIVGIGRNPDKQELFTQRERLDLLQPHLAAFPNVRAEIYEGLTVDFVHKCRARVLVRGIRDLGDLTSELRQANVNLAIGGIETIFLMTRDEFVLTSSTYVKQVYEMGGADIERLKKFVPENAALALARKLGNLRSR